MGDEFHVYAVRWSPGQIIWYMDNIETSRLTESEHNDYRNRYRSAYPDRPLPPELDVDFDEMYIVLNLAMGGFWVNYPQNLGGLGRGDGNLYPTWNDLNEFQNPTLQIDWVRAYKRQ